MENNFNFSQKQMDLLLQMAGQKIGASPDKLREQMQSGQVDSLISALPPDKQAQINSVMQNPGAIEQLMKNPQVQQLLKNLMGR